MIDSGRSKLTTLILAVASLAALSACATTGTQKERAYKDAVARIMYSSWEYVPDLNSIGVWKSNKRKMPKKAKKVVEKTPDPVINEGAIEAPPKKEEPPIGNRGYKMGQDSIKRDSVYQYKR